MPLLQISCNIHNVGVFGTSELSNTIEESVKMAKFNHPNVMRLIGVCIDKGPSPYIVMPYMSYGSLLSYLKKHRAELTLANDDDQELVCLLCKIVRPYIHYSLSRSMPPNVSFSPCVSKLPRGCYI